MPRRRIPIRRADRSRRLARALTLAALVALTTPAGAHVVLDADVAQPMLAAIAADLKTTRDAPVDEGRAEAWYRLGERLHQLVDLMNTDVLAHGQSLYGQLVARQLVDLGLGVTYVDRTRRYVYDVAPFEQYLRLAPRGARAADAKFRLIAEAFTRSLGRRASELAEGDPTSLAHAIRRKEAFVAEHPAHPRLRDVRFFLAIDYYRLHRNSPDARIAAQYRGLARTALQAIIRDYPGTAEARSAEPPLQELR